MLSADVALIGGITRAGTGCGSCRPEIAALLAAGAVALPRGNLVTLRP